MHRGWREEDILPYGFVRSRVVHRGYYSPTNYVGPPSLTREGLLKLSLLSTDGDFALFLFEISSNIPSVVEGENYSNPSPMKAVLAHAKRDASTSTLRYASVAGGWHPQGDG